VVARAMYEEANGRRLLCSDATGGGVRGGVRGGTGRLAGDSSGIAEDRMRGRQLPQGEEGDTRDPKGNWPRVVCTGSCLLWDSVYRRGAGVWAEAAQRPRGPWPVTATWGPGPAHIPASWVSPSPASGSRGLFGVGLGAGL
jgi:hypothetical protein